MTTYYVGPGGNNANSGLLPSSPWATIAFAFANIPSVAPPNRHILQLRSGSLAAPGFNNRQNLIIENYPGENVLTTRAGTEVWNFAVDTTNAPTIAGGTNVTMRVNQAGGRFEITHGGFVGTTNGSGIQVARVSGAPSPTGFVADGLTIHDINGNGPQGNGTPGSGATRPGGFGIRLSGTTNSIVQNCTIYKCGEGIRVGSGGGTDPTTGAQILNNHIYDMDRMLLDDGSGGDNGACAIEMNHASACVIRGNKMHDLHAPSQQYIVDGGAFNPFQISNSEFSYNICWNSVGFWESGVTPGGTMTNNWVHHNVIYGKMDYGSPQRTPTFYFRGDRDSEFDHNTIDVDDGYDVFRYLDQDSSQFTNTSPQHQNLKIRNNLIIARTWDPGTHVLNDPTLTIGMDWWQGLPGAVNAANTGVLEDYNLFWNSASASAVIACTAAGGFGGSTYTRSQLAAYQAATPMGDHDIWASDPTAFFVDRVNANLALRDYHLIAGSPALNAGLVIVGTNDGYKGLAPDLGAFEFDETIPTPQPQDPPKSAPLFFE